MKRCKAIVLGGLAVCVVPLIGLAQTQQSSAPPAYRPGLGDLMTMTVQPRHTKLALAGQEKNWAYGAYELHELQEAFERAGRIWPRWRSFQIGEMIDAITKQPMTALEQAIKASDQEQFNAAYRQLTDACNACHQSVDRGMIVIKVPDGAAFPDQEFRATKR